MKLVWHLMRKDVARLRGSIALWLLFIAATALLYTTSDVSPVEDANGLGTWLRNVSSFVQIAALLIEVAGGLLAAMLVTEDSPVSATAFWPTRPIAGMRLLLAKVLTAFGLLVLAPTLVLTFVWLGQKFSLDEVVSAALSWATLRAVLTLALLTLAAVAGTLARFLAGIIMVVGAAIVLELGMSVVERMRGAPADIATSSTYAACWMGMIVATFVLFRQYRETRRPAWGAIGGGLFAVLAVKLFWSWDVAVHAPSELPKPDDFSLQLTSLAEQDAVRYRARVSPSRRGKLLFAPEHADSHSRNDSSRRRIWLHRGPGWADDAVFRAAGAPTQNEDLVWQLQQSTSRAATPRLDAEARSGSIEVSALTAERLWELPLKNDASSRHGSSLSRILDVQASRKSPEKRLLFLAEEAAKIDTERMPWMRPLAADARVQRGPQDFFILVHRARNEAWLVPVAEYTALEMYGIERRWRTLEYMPPTDIDAPRWEEGAVLVKVRLTPRGSFRHELKPEMFSGEREAIR